jgi:hypothetical protein
MMEHYSFSLESHYQKSICMQATLIFFMTSVEAWHVIIKHESYFSSDTHSNVIVLGSGSNGHVVKPYWHVLANYSWGWRGYNRV